MTIELTAKKPTVPEFWAGDAVLPFSCRTELGFVYIHSSDQFLPIQAANVGHKKSYSLVLTPKITTTDESLRDFEPTE